MDCGYVHNFVNTLLYSCKELAICTVRIGKVISTTSKSTSSSSSSVFFAISFGEPKEESCRWWWDTSYICNRRFSIWCKFQLVFSFLMLPLCYFICELMLSHLEAANSSVIGGNNNYSNDYILSSQFQVYFIFKPVPFFPESLPLSITGCSSLARASCATRVGLDHTLSGLLIKVSQIW